MATYSSIIYEYDLTNHIEEDDKQASTNGLTFSAMNPKKGGNQMFDLVYEPYDADGNMVVRSSASTVDWD